MRTPLAVAADFGGRTLPSRRRKGRRICRGLRRGGCSESPKIRLEGHYEAGFQPGHGRAIDNPRPLTWAGMKQAFGLKGA
jgi:hypothetical protein